MLEQAGQYRKLSITAAHRTVMWWRTMTCIMPERFGMLCVSPHAVVQTWLRKLEQLEALGYLKHTLHLPHCFPVVISKTKVRLI